MPIMLALLSQAVPEPPRIAIASPAASSFRTLGERFTVDVEVRGGNEVLWSAPLRVSTNQATSIRRERNEPAAKDCPGEGYGRGEQTSFSLQLNGQRSSDGATLVRTVVRWTRPGPGTCESRGSARTVELNDTAEVPRGEWVTLRGDAGLEIRLRRQD